MMDKKYYREMVKSKREATDFSEKDKKDKAIFEKLLKEKEFISCNNLFIYISFDLEINTHKIIESALEQNKNVYVPKVISKALGMIGVRIENFEELRKNKMGILEPLEAIEIITKDDIDLAIIPGLAFDLKGNRIGYGGGFYDRYFQGEKNKLPSMIALAYEYQLFTNITQDTFDIKVHKIVTEKNIYNISNA
ncbi:MAG TPA: 5-formyltetrahydrofolate cyclo-ligase [Clostridiaceae bacterium]